MDKALLKEAKKYRVSTVKLATAQLPADQWETTSAKKWLEVIQKFLTDHFLNGDFLEVAVVKKEKQEAAKKKLASEKALYERLKKKFEKVKK